MAEAWPIALAAAPDDAGFMGSVMFSRCRSAGRSGSPLIALAPVLMAGPAKPFSFAMICAFMEFAGTLSPKLSMLSTLRSLER